MQLSGLRVLVTGASGFIGGRVVEKLVREGTARVRAMAPDLARAARIARFPVELAACDVRDLDAVIQSAAGCDVVIHCAYGSRGDSAERRAVNVDGTRNVLEAAHRAGCRRVVHLSTLMVYGLTADGLLDETAPRRPTGDSYGDEKLEAEEIAFAYHVEKGCGVSVIQPTAVYGPFAPSWTTRVLERLKTGIVPLIEDGSGICNAVYIDDVADAVLLAAECDEAVGEEFLISGEPITYRDFYRCFEKMLGHKRMVSLSVDEALARWDAKSRAQGDPEIHLLDPIAIRFHALRTTVSTDKAHRRLGYRPRIDLAAGMRRTEQWARWANLIPGTSARTRPL
jgi:nucleoside-diphosphate-sugar epimerase